MCSHSAVEHLEPLVEHGHLGPEVLPQVAGELRVGARVVEGGLLRPLGEGDGLGVDVQLQLHVVPEAVLPDLHRQRAGVRQRVAGVLPPEQVRPVQAQVQLAEQRAVLAHHLLEPGHRIMWIKSKAKKKISRPDGTFVLTSVSNLRKKNATFMWYV